LISKFGKNLLSQSIRKFISVGITASVLRARTILEFYTSIAVAFTAKLYYCFYCCWKLFHSSLANIA